MDIGRDIVARGYDRDNFDEFVADLVKEIEIRNYRVTRINDIDNVLDHAEREVDFEVQFSDYKIIEFCNLTSCAELISAELAAGVFMPVRFVAYRRGADARAFAAFLKPTAFAGLFPSASVRDVAGALERDMSDVLEAMDF